MDVVTDHKVRTGQPRKLKIISEPQAENRVSKPELFFVTRTGRCWSSNECLLTVPGGIAAEIRVVPRELALVSVGDESLFFKWNAAGAMFEC